MNWPKPAELVRQTAQETLGEEAVMAHVEPDLTAEDFGFYLQKCQGPFVARLQYPWYTGCRAS